MKKLKSFKNNPQIKKDLLREIKKHEKADQIIKGTYGTQNGEWKGCAVACSLRSLAISKGEDLKEEYDQHERYEIDLGIPKAIAHIEDVLFEGMSEKDSKTFPRRFIEAVPVGVDLSLVVPKFMIFILNDTLQHKEVQENKEVFDSVNQVIDLWENVINGKLKGKKLESAARSAAESARSAAWSAAWSAAESAAWSAAWSAAESAAWSAAESAAWSARSAAWSAAESAAWSAAESAAWSARSAALKRYANHLIKLLKECQ